MRQSIVPPYLLRQLASSADPAMARAAAAAQSSLARDDSFRSVRWGPGVDHTAAPTARARAIEPPVRTIFDAENTETLPGTTVRSEGDADTGDISVTEAHDGFGFTHALFAEAFGRASIDDDNLPLLGTVHYGEDYDNAFWDGQRMVFGDGDGTVFTRFTASLSVIGHELAHGVTQYTANLAYEGQSGALNESVSDVFGALVEQHSRGQSAADASWLIGEGLFTDRVQGDALRSMKAPGTAYDDDMLGKDPQPDSMDGYVDTTDDNGGVHLNSGIPNRAFYLTAVAIGGNAWEAAGQIWYDTLTGGDIAPTCDFATFATLTADAASLRYGDGSAEHTAVVEAWQTVGVTESATMAG
ncbi:MAG: M4 family metallopeptidase [Burkholderiaceae bacterium]|nr:M4 family metallopeptidase [Microbacteriaceae bacterium]